MEIITTLRSRGMPLGAGAGTGAVGAGVGGGAATVVRGRSTGGGGRSCAAEGELHPAESGRRRSAREGRVTAANG